MERWRQRASRRARRRRCGWSWRAGAREAISSPASRCARELVDRVPGAVVTFAGTTRGIEARAVPREGFALDTIRSLGLKGKSLRSLVRGLATLPASALDAWRVISRRRPDIVVGVGGYSSGPVALMAWLRGVPVLLHEQNARPGLTNRLLGRLARAVAVTYEVDRVAVRIEGLRQREPGSPPVPAHGAPETAGARKVLIFGGSQGSHAINVAVVEAASRAGAGSPSSRRHAPDGRT